MKKNEKSLWGSLKLDFQKAILGNIVLQALFLIFGIIAFMNPFLVARSAGVIIGIYFLVFGIFGIAEFFMRKLSPLFNYKIFTGILSMILGVVIIINPLKTFTILTIVLGIYLVIVALSKILEVLKLKKYGYDGWVIMLVISVILLIFGVFVAFNPLASMDIIEVVAIFIILSSILEICNLIMVYSRAKYFVKLFKEVK